MIWRRRQEDLVRSAGVGCDIAGGSGGVVELVGLGGPGAAQGAGGCLVATLQVLVFPRRQYLQVVRALVFIAGLAEEEQLLVVFPFGHVEFVQRPASLDRLVLPVENCPKVLELALYVINCKTATKEPQIHLLFCFSNVCCLFLLSDLTAAIYSILCLL